MTVVNGQLIGPDGKRMFLKGINWFGFDDGNTMLDGLWEGAHPLPGTVRGPGAPVWTAGASGPGTREDCRVCPEGSAASCAWRELPAWFAASRFAPLAPHAAAVLHHTLHTLQLLSSLQETLCVCACEPHPAAAWPAATS